MVKFYCERCRCKQEIEIVKEDYEINVYGKKINYIGKKAICSICGCEIFNDEVEEYNQIIFEETFYK